MKMISKLMTTSALLIAGALVSFGAEMNDSGVSKRMPAVREKRAEMKAAISEKEFEDIVGAAKVKDVEQKFHEKIQSMPRLKAFLERVKANNPELKDKVQTFWKENENKQLKDIDREGKLKALLQDAYNANSKMRKAKMEAMKNNAAERMADRKSKSTSY